MRLRRHIKELAAGIEKRGGYGMIENHYADNGDAIDILTEEPDGDCLDGILGFQPVVDSEDNVTGAEIMIAWGGPTIWINTATNQIYGSWWGQWEVADIYLWDDIPWYWQDRAECLLMDKHYPCREGGYQKAIEDGEAVKEEKYKVTIQKEEVTA